MNANSNSDATSNRMFKSNLKEARYRAGYTTVTVNSRFGQEYELSELLFKIALQKLNCNAFARACMINEHDRVCSMLL